MRVGDKITVPITGTDPDPRGKTGRVIWVHPQRRFVVVEFDFSQPGRFHGERWNRTVRECYLLAPGRGQRCSTLGQARSLKGRG